jgi:23S rRNA (cytosine1962-C5)-methyltransferase
VSLAVLPCLLYEDEHLLVVNKPPGLSTHAPSPYAGEGIYDWLRNREERWAGLAIIHRLDKGTSGVLVFSKTPLASRSLTEQFTRRAVHKRYLLLTDRRIPQDRLTIKTSLVRVGAGYQARPAHLGGPVAETRFLKLAPAERARYRTAEPAEHPTPATGAEALRLDSGVWLEAEPLTGRTHQIRVHAAEAGFPVLGDVDYGGTPAPRLFLHAAELRFTHPETNKPVMFRAPVDFEVDPRLLLRAALLDSVDTNAYRLTHGASEGRPAGHKACKEPVPPATLSHTLPRTRRNSRKWPIKSGERGFCDKLYIDRVGEYLIAQSEALLGPEGYKEVAGLAAALSARGAYHKLLPRHAGRPASPPTTSPQLVLGEPAPEPCLIRENGLQFELSFSQGASLGLFLDQRDNRRRLLTRHLAAGFSLPYSPCVLNTFAYTCAFSVCAAKGGARTTSVDLSKKSLDWGRRNFLLNGIDPAAHEFLQGDTFDWLRRLARKGRCFDAVLLDPPTFSRSKLAGVFRVESDYGRLIAAALGVLRSAGVLFASTNSAKWTPKDFVGAVEQAVGAAGRKIARRHYAPQPPDFPVSPAEPPHLKTMWLVIE